MRDHIACADDMCPTCHPARVSMVLVETRKDNAALRLALETAERERGEIAVCADGWMKRTVDAERERDDNANVILEQNKLWADRCEGAERERDEATQELAMVKAAYLSACGLVASMHAAAVGEVRGPTVGPVEDVAALKAERDALLSRPAPPSDAATEAVEARCGACGRVIASSRDHAPAPAPSAKEGRT